MSSEQLSDDQTHGDYPMVGESHGDWRVWSPLRAMNQYREQVFPTSSLI